MRRIHVENVTDRRNTELVLVRKVQAIQTINELSTICHGYLLGVLMKNVESHCTEKSIPQSRGLFQDVAGSHFAARPVPRTPFVDY